MSIAPPDYAKLPGMGSSLLFYSRLYLGRDHLLQINSMWTQESYKRFYFQDIQAVTVRKSVWGKVGNAFLSLLALLFGLITVQVGFPEASVPLVLTVVSLTCLAINVARGPTAITHIRTAVQTERLYSMARLRNAQRLIDRIAPLIESVQGTLEASDAQDQPTAPSPLS